MDRGNGSQGLPGTESQPGQGSGANMDGTSQGAGTSETISRSEYDALSSKLEAVLADNAKYRAERRGKSGEKAGTDGASGSEATAAELATMKAQLRTANFRNDITAAATRAGAIIPGDVWRLLDMDQAGVDELGYVSSPDKVLGDLRKRMPQLFGTPVQGSANGGAGSGQAADANDMNAAIRSAFRNRRG